MKENGMPQNAVSRNFSVFYLAHKFGFKPGYGRVHRDLYLEGRLISIQFFHESPELFLGFFRETSSGMTYIEKFTILEFSKHQCTKIFSASPPFSITGYNCFPGFRVFYFQPFLGTDAGNIDTVTFFAMIPSRFSFRTSLKNAFPFSGI